MTDQRHRAAAGALQHGRSGRGTPVRRDAGAHYGVGDGTSRSSRPAHGSGASIWASGWIASASAARPSPMRGPGRVTIVSSTGTTALSDNGGDVLPPGTSGNVRLGNDAVGGVTQHDHLRVLGHQALERNAED